MGLFSFIGDALNDIFGGNQSRKDSQRYNTQNMAIQQQYALENMAVQNQYNIDAFERENEYNTPLAQQQRLRAAGINPNWTDEGTAISQQDSGVSASAPSGGMPSGSNTDILGDVVNMLSVGAQIKKTKADAKLADSQSKLNEIDAQQKAFNLELDREYKSSERGKGLELSDSQIGANLSTAELQGKQAEQVFSIAHATVSELYARRDYTDAQRDAINETLPYLANEIASRIGLNNASAYLATQNGMFVPMFANAAVTSANASLLSAKSQKILAENDVIRTSLQQMETLADVAYKGSQKTGQDIINGVNGLSFKIEDELFKEKLPQNERREAIKNVKKARQVMDSEIRELNSRSDLNVQNKKYLQAEAIRKYIDTVNGLFDRFLPDLRPPGLSGLPLLTK